MFVPLLTSSVIVTIMEVTLRKTIAETRRKRKEMKEEEMRDWSGTQPLESVLPHIHRKGWSAPQWKLAASSA